jgi:HK97 family phage portal protein
MFLSLFRSGAARADAMSDRSPWGDFWFQSLGAGTLSGARVSGDSALRLTAVYACVRNVSEDIAQLPFRLYRPKVGGGKTKVTDHWLYRLFALRPNRWQTPFVWRETLLAHLLLRGNAYCQIIANPLGEIVELIPIHPDRVQIELVGDSYRYRIAQRDGSQLVFRRDEIWHIRALGMDQYFGLNPIEMQASMLGVAMSAQDYASRFFANDAKPSGGWIEFPGKFADLTAKKTFRDAWQEQQGKRNAGKVAVLEQGMKYHEVGINNKDSQFIESRAMSVTEIARMFRVPPHKIADMSAATYSNIEQQSLEYATDTLSPWCERLESSIETDLIGDDGMGLEVEFDLRHLMRGDSAGRTAYYAGGINGGWLTRNEVRSEEGLDPLPGLDEPLQPLNMVEAGESPEEIAEGDAGADDVVPPGQEPIDPDTDARLIALATATAERVARKEVAVLEPIWSAQPRDYDALVAALERHANFVAAAMAIDQPAADAYVKARRADPIRQSHFREDIYTHALRRLTQLALTGTAL